MGHLGSHGDFCDCQWDCQWDFCDQRHLEMGLKMVYTPQKGNCNRDNDDKHQHFLGSYIFRQTHLTNHRALTMHRFVKKNARLNFPTKNSC
jgi:hypothetical protein